MSPDTVRLQYSKCESSILPGPQKTLRWGVPDGTRGPDGQLVHDDIILVDSLVAVLDKLEWYSHSPTLFVYARDPLEDMDSNFERSNAMPLHPSGSLQNRRSNKIPVALEPSRSRIPMVGGLK